MTNRKPYWWLRLWAKAWKNNVTIKPYWSVPYSLQEHVHPPGEGSRLHCCRTTACFKWTAHGRFCALYSKSRTWGGKTPKRLKYEDVWDELTSKFKSFLCIHPSYMQHVTLEYFRSKSRVWLVQSDATMPKTPTRKISEGTERLTTVLQSVLLSKVQ